MDREGEIEQQNICMTALLVLSCGCLVLLLSFLVLISLCLLPGVLGIILPSRAIVAPPCAFADAETAVISGNKKAKWTQS